MQKTFLFVYVKLLCKSLYSEYFRFVSLICVLNDTSFLVKYVLFISLYYLHVIDNMLQLFIKKSCFITGKSFKIISVSIFLFSYIFWKQFLNNQIGEKGIVV